VRRLVAIVVSPALDSFAVSAALSVGGLLRALVLAFEV
jgi:hypothetical protein